MGKIYSLVKVWFSEPLYHVEGMFGRDNLALGCALLPKTHLNEFNIKKRYVVFKPGCKIEKNKKQSCFSIGGFRIHIGNEFIKKITKVRQQCSFLAKPEKNLVAIEFHIPIESAHPCNLFLKKEQEKKRVLGIRTSNGCLIDIKRTLTKTRNYKVLITKKEADMVTTSLFEQKIVPSGKEWGIIKGPVFQGEIPKFRKSWK